jgi:hypothetical protein
MLLAACFGLAAGALHGSAAADPPASGDAAAAEDHASAAAASAEAPAAASAGPTRRRIDNRGLTLDGRVRLLAKELDLNATQQAQVKKLLIAQREQVAALWNETALPAALRVSRTQSISDHTADQIRALLTEPQREKYIKPRQRPAPVGTAGASVGAWPPAGNAKAQAN